MEVILASKSPRRLELLGKIYPDLSVVVGDADETLPSGTHPRQGVEILAVRKGAAVLPLVPRDALVVSSDTLVEKDGIALGKPRDEADAFQILKLLSGSTHNVHTGVAVHYGGRVYSGVATTAVTFREMTDSEIRDYIATGEPMDKAGAYGIQGGGGNFVLRYDGDFDTVVGLSLALTEKLIKGALAND